MTADQDPVSSPPNPASLALLSDEVLMTRIGDGDQAAYAALMDRHLDRSLGMATRILNSRPEAEDALQEAFLRLWKAAPNWSAEGARFSTWFYRVVMNLCIDAKRRRKAPHVALDDAPEVADSTPGAEAHLRQQEQNAALRRAMEELPERQRHAVQLCYFDGMSNKQAAEILEVNIKALESLLSRGRRALKQILAGQEMTDNPGGTP